MNRILSICAGTFIACAWLLLVLPGVVQAAEGPVAELMSAVEQLDAVRETLQRERSEWRVQKASMLHGIGLLDRERALLEERLSEWDATSDVEDEEALRIEQRRAAQERALALAGRLLDDATPRMRAARDAFPDLFAVEATTGPVERLRILLDAAAQLQRRQQRLLHEQRLMDLPDGGRRQMDLLQLGHSQAYAVSPDDRMAAHGVWSGEAWAWRWDPAWATSIRQAIRVHLAEVPPRWVLLPVSRREEEEP